MSDQTSARDGLARSTSPGQGETSGTRGPLHWPTLSPLVWEAEMMALGHYVDELRERYSSDLDHHVIPPCWYAHESHVVAIQALRDHERAAFGPESPASSAVDWHRAYRDIVALLKSWTSQLRCTSTEHVASRAVPPINEVMFAQFVTQQLVERRRAVIADVLEDCGADPPKRG